MSFDRDSERGLGRDSKLGSKHDKRKADRNTKRHPKPEPAPGVTT